MQAFVSQKVASNPEQNTFSSSATPSSVSAVSFIEPQQPDENRKEEKHKSQQPIQTETYEPTQMKPGSFKRKRSISTCSVQPEDEGRIPGDEEQENLTTQHFDMSRFKRSKSGRERSNSTCQASSTITSNSGLIPVNYNSPPTLSTSSMSLPMKKSLQGTRFKYLKNLGHHSSTTIVNDLHLTNLPPTVRKLIEKKARRTRNSQSESESDAGTGPTNSASSYSYHSFNIRNFQQQKEGKILSSTTDVDDSEPETTHFNIEQPPSHTDVKQALDHTFDKMDVDGIDKSSVSVATVGNKDIGNSAVSTASTFVEHIGLPKNPELVKEQLPFIHKEEEEDISEKKKELSSTQSSFHSIPSPDVSMIGGVNHSSTTSVKDNISIATNYGTLSRTEFNELSTTDKGKSYMKQDSAMHGDASLDDSFQTVNETMNLSTENPLAMHDSKGNLVSENNMIQKKVLDDTISIGHEKVYNSLDNLDDSVPFRSVISEEQSIAHSHCTLSKNLNPSKEEASSLLATGISHKPSPSYCPLSKQQITLTGAVGTVLPIKTSLAALTSLAGSTTLPTSKSSLADINSMVTKAVGDVSVPNCSSVGLNICSKTITVVPSTPSSSTSLSSVTGKTLRSTTAEIHSKLIMTTTVAGSSTPSAAISSSYVIGSKASSSPGGSNTSSNNNKVTETRKAVASTSRLDIGDLSNANITKKKEEKASRRKKGGGLIPGESLSSVL